MSCIESGDFHPFLRGFASFRTLIFMRFAPFGPKVGADARALPLPRTPRGPANILSTDAWLETP